MVTNLSLSWSAGLTFAALLCACDSGGEREAPEDAGHDAGVMTLDAQQPALDARRPVLDALVTDPVFDAPRQDAGGSLCAEVTIACEPELNGLAYSVQNAADFGADARFVAMGRDALLVSHGDSYELVRGQDRFPLPAGWRGIDVHALDDGTVWALACREASACAVFASRAPGEALAQRGPDLRYASWVGLTPEVRSPDVDSNSAPCVYGPGITCLANEGWQETLDGSLDIVKLEYAQEDFAVAVTRSGQLYLWERNEDLERRWHVLGVTAPGTLRSLVVKPYEAQIVTSSVVLDLVSPPHVEGALDVFAGLGTRQCARSDLLLYSKYYEYIGSVYVDGRSLLPEGRSCVLGRLPLQGDVLDADDTRPCLQWRVLTSAAAYTLGLCERID